MITISQRNTVQRYLILETVRMMDNHPTADEIYNEVLKSHPNISKGTVYRNLNSLTNEGLIKHIQIANSSDRFDKTVCPHYHFKCLECDSVFDIELKNNIEFKCENNNGFDILSYDLLFYGKCNKCNSEKKK